MDNKNKADIYIHSIMCFIGGFLGAYAIIHRVGNLGSAQTANLILVVLSFLGHNLNEFILRVIGMILYFAGIEIFVYLSNKTKVNIKMYSVLVVMAGCIILNFIPDTSDPVVGLLPLFFMLSTQWSVFHGACGYNSSTIFSTNNFRQAALGIGEYLITRDKANISKAKFFGNSLFWYHLGVLISFFACRFANVHASLFCIIPGCLSLFIIYNNEVNESFLVKEKTIA